MHDKGVRCELGVIFFLPEEEDENISPSMQFLTPPMRLRTRSQRLPGCVCSQNPAATHVHTCTHTGTCTHKCAQAHTCARAHTHSSHTSFS